MKNKGPMSRKPTKLGHVTTTTAYREEGAAQKNNRHARRRAAKLAKQ